MLLPTEVFGFSVACLAALAVAPLLRRAAIQFGWRDRPDDGHKRHHAARPSAGGLSLLGALAVAIVALRFGFENVAARIDPVLVAIAPGALLMTAVGLLDDARGVRPVEKLIAQAVALALFQSSAAFLGLFDASAYSTVTLSLMVAGIALWMLGLTNALNLIDGLDGLATGVSASALLGISILSTMDGRPGLALFAATATGATLGVLRLNRHPARLYLGDSGSMLLGFMIASGTALLWAQKPDLSRTVALALIVWVPLVDTTLTILRRGRSGVSLFRPDRDHVHHRLVNQGLSVPSVARRLGMLSLVGTGGAVAVEMGAPLWIPSTLVLLLTTPVLRAAFPLRVTEPVDPRADHAKTTNPDLNPGGTEERAA